jgi:hypothetical protein
MAAAGSHPELEQTVAEMKTDRLGARARYSANSALVPHPRR